jgi:hypothetical protein
MRCIDKRAEFGFVWLFAIIAGIAILLLSIYGATQIGGTQRYETHASIAKKLTVLTDPLEAGFTSATFGTIKFQQETRIRNLCSDIGFGENSIAASSRSGVGKEWLDFGPATSIKEKYVFGKEEDSGETYYVLSKAFDYPYKIADFIVLISDKKKYCFLDAPKEVREELESLKIPVVSFENCSSGDYVDVCFGKEGCDISVIGGCDSCQDVFETGIVKLENGGVVSYVGDLIYPAIFSGKGNFECNVHRLLYRGSIVGKILARKADLMNARECNTNLGPVLYGWSSALGNASIDDMVGLYGSAVKLEESAKWEVCGVW